MNSTERLAPVNLSIVVPAYQEATTIASSLEQLAQWLKHHDYGRVEVIVVTANSADATADLVRAAMPLFSSLRLIEPGPRVGKGRDVRSGMLASTGQYRVFMDADLATPLHHLDDVKRLIDQHADIGIAVRNLTKIHPQLKRRIITEAGNLLIQAILLPGIKDTQCGFKVFRADVATALFERQTILGWGFDLELLAIARKLHYRIDTFAAPDWADPKSYQDGLGGDSTRGAAIQTLRDLFRIRLNLFLRRYRTTITS